MNKKYYYTIISYSIKVTIVLFSFYYIFNEIFNGKNSNEIKEYIITVFQQKSFLIFIPLIVMMLINWSVEALKWKLLIKKIEHISFLKALKAVFSGITISIFTPNRIGEYAGRVFFLEKGDRIIAALITVIGSICQLLITVITGAISFLYYINNFQNQIKVSSYVFTILLFFVLLIILSLVVIFVYSSIFSVFLSKFSFLNKYKKYTEVFSYYSISELLTILLLSFTRYCIFTLQFYLLIQFFGVEINFLNTVTMISLSFFVMAVIPTITLTEMGVRSSVTLYFIGLLSTNALGIISSSFTLWIINLAVPALIGAFYVFRLRFFRKL